MRASPPARISAAAKQPLAINPVLVASATSHTQDMLQSQAFSHSGSDGSSPYDRELAAGYTFTGSWGWGENIAYQSNSVAVPPPAATAVLEEQNLFVDSEEPGRGHRLNLLNPAFKEIGVGIQEGIFSGANALMATEDFAYSTGNSFLTGVVFDDANHNGLYDPGEGLAGAAIKAVQIGGSGTVSSTQSWSSGGYTVATSPGRVRRDCLGRPLGVADHLHERDDRVEKRRDRFQPRRSRRRPIRPRRAPPRRPSRTPTPTPTPAGTPTATPDNPVASSPGSTSTTNAQSSSVDCLKGRRHHHGADL